jgi:Bacterial Ig-like domain (group 3)/Subtilase family
VSSFRNTFGLTGGSYTQINNGTDPGNCTSTATNALCTLDDQIENALDVEWVGATAPKAAVKLVVTQQTSTNDAIYLSAKYAIDNSVAKIINVSYGLCELGMGTSNNAAYNSLWQTAETAGIAVFVATGDSGSPGCDQGQASQGPYGAQFGLAVSGIASTPHNTAVGGTDLNWTTASTYWNSSSDSHGANAKGYIPEIPWNDTCTNPLEVAFINQALSTSDSASTICNKIANGAITSSSNPQSVLDLVNTVGAGGGKSNCTTSDGANVASCTGGYAKPSWQTGVSGIPNDSKRDVPDVSFFAGNGFLNSAYLICVSDWGTCVTSTGAATEPSVGEIGGTSAASPAMAGIMALINQKAGSAQGNPNSVLYTLAAAQNYGSCKTESVANSGACYFNDIDTGTISMPCAGGSPNCSLTSVSSGNTIGVLSGFDGAAGFDLATGLGSMNVANVVNNWTAAAPTATFKLTAAPAASISAGGTTTSNITVSSTDGYAGTVTLSCAMTAAPAGAVEAPTCAATTGQSTVALSATTTSGAGQVTVSSTAAPTGAVKLASNRTGWFKAAGGAGLASLALFLLPGWSKRYRNLFCTMLLVLAASFFAVGCGGGGGSSNGGGGTTKTTPTVTVTPASTTIKETDTLAVTITVAGTSGTPTGSVTMSSGSYNSGAVALDSTGKASITIPVGKLTPGTDTLGVSYSGDTKFNSATGNASITVNKAATTLGAYTFTVTGTGNDSAHYTATTTFTVTVQ